MAVPPGICGQFWYTNMAAESQQKHLEFTFSMKALSFHSRASIRGAHKHIYYLKWLNCLKSRGEAVGFNWLMHNSTYFT